MKLSTKGRYAVMAMADIAQQAGNQPVSLGDISGRQGISQAFLEQLFAKLRKNGLVDSVRGPGGGYSLAKECKMRFSSSISFPRLMSPCRLPGAKAMPLMAVWMARNASPMSFGPRWGARFMAFLAAVTLGDVVGGRNLALAASVRRAKAPTVRSQA